MATALVVGNVIGSGIFKKPGTIAAVGADVELVLLAWIFGGVLCILGALCYAELAVMLPRAGGMYVYLREAYGRPIAFLYGWNEFLFNRPASIAALSMIFTDSLARILDWPIGLAGQIMLAIVSIVFMAWINVLGVIWGARVQTAVTLIKVAFVVFVATLPFIVELSGGGGVDWAHLSSRTEPPTPDRTVLQRFGIILLAVMWAYNGWDGIAPVAEEIRQPHRNIPLALFGGIGILVLLYVSANVGYHAAMPMNELAAIGNQDKIVAERMVTSLLGSVGGKLMSFGIMCSTFGAISANLLISPRVPFAMGRDGVFFRPLGWVHENYRTPATAIIVQSSMAVLLIVASGLLVGLRPGFRGASIFDMLTDFIIFSASIFYTMAVASVLVLRVKRPDWHRPYRTLGYPVVPLAYVVFYIWFLSQVYLEKPFEARVGLVLLGLGLVVYVFWQRWARVKGETNGSRVEGAAIPS
jgi:APA family basic amino acid/polyamine antiporter